MSAAAIRAVYEFWFVRHGRADWFAGAERFDAAVRTTLKPCFEDAARGACDHWQATPRGALCLTLLLDQVPRQLYRGQARAFAFDGRARAVARAAIDRGFDLDCDGDEQRAFFYLPFEHSEELEDQQFCLRLSTERMRNPDFAIYAVQHLTIIKRFGRFPHRNAALGRQSTDLERQFLALPGSSF